MCLMFPKKPVGRVRGGHLGGRYENKKHLAYIRSDWCCSLAGRGQCDGPVEAHHLLRPFIGTRGMGRKSADCNAIPLCSGCHRELHRRGDEDAFFTETTGFPEFGREWARKLWEDSPYNEVLPWLT